MHNAYVMSCLRKIQADDPSGWEVEPKAHNYRAHERDSIARYGQKVWDIYAAGDWAERSDV